MSRFEVASDDERLTLSLTREDSVVPPGCSFLVAFGFFTTLWVVALLTEAFTVNARGAEDFSQFYGPSSKLFGLLWIIGFGGMLFLVPLYIYTITHSGLVFCFSRAQGVFLRNRKPVAPLRRIEQVLICRIRDSEETYLYELSIVYLDGHQIPIHDSEDRGEIEDLADTISHYVDVPVVFKARRHEGFPFPQIEEKG